MIVVPCDFRYQEFGCQEDMMFCGIFDGHGPWGHSVAKRVRESMPSSLLRNWQETIIEASLDPEFSESDGNVDKFNIWKNSYLKTYAAVDRELDQHCKIDSFNSGTTASTIVRQVTEVTLIACNAALQRVFNTSEAHRCRFCLIGLRDQIFVFSFIFSQNVFFWFLFGLCFCCVVPLHLITF